MLIANPYRAPAPWVEPDPFPPWETPGRIVLPTAEETCLVRARRPLRPARRRRPKVEQVVWCGPAFVQVGQNLGNPVSTLSVTLTGVGAGNTLVVGIGCLFPSTITNVTDGTNNYTAAQTLVTANSEGGAVYYGTSAAGGSVTVTCNWSSAVNDLGIIVHEVSGLDASPVDGTPATNNGHAVTSLNSGNVTTSVANDYLFSLLAFANQNFLAGDASYTVRSSSSSDAFTMTQDMIAATAGTYSANWSQAASGDMLSILVAFKPSVVTSAFGGCAYEC